MQPILCDPYNQPITICLKAFEADLKAQSPRNTSSESSSDTRRGRGVWRRPSTKRLRSTPGPGPKGNDTGERRNQVQAQGQERPVNAGRQSAAEAELRHPGEARLSFLSENARGSDSRRQRSREPQRRVTEETKTQLKDRRQLHPYGSPRFRQHSGGEEGNAAQTSSGSRPPPHTRHSCTPRFPDRGQPELHLLRES